MAVYFFHSPYDATSRAKLDELAQQGTNFILHHRHSPDDDKGFWISFLPTVILVDDDDKTELCRAEYVEHITKTNIEWMHQQHQQWKAQGKPKHQDGRPNFPSPPWHQS